MIKPIHNMLDSSIKNRLIPLFMIILFLLLPQARSWAAPENKAADTRELEIQMGKSTVISTEVPIKRISIAAPEVADATALDTNQVYVTGKAPGTTNLTLWDRGDRAFAVYNITVQPDLSGLKEAIKKLFPGEDNITITTSRDSIALSGTVTSASNLSSILSIAESYAPKKIINLLQIGGVQQVMLEVRVSEISRSLLRRLGVNLSYLSSSGQNYGLTLLNNLTSLPSSGYPANGLNVSQDVTALFKFFSNQASWTVFIDALKEEGLVKVLAEPTLITLSGQSANFLAGGEYPIPVPQGFNTVTIEYKKYGVGLNFTPTVIGGGKINMAVTPEVSELDFSNAVRLNGYTVPALSTRRVSTVVELADGQSFAIAGLLSDNVRHIVDKFPVLGDIPVLGALFRSSSFQKNETELVVIVTPHLVKPLDMAKQTLPHEAYKEPNDAEFYLKSDIEGKDGDKSSPAATNSQLKKDKATAAPEAATDPGHAAKLDDSSADEKDFGYITPEN
jgi:pilus assembly protein CpaC